MEGVMTGLAAKEQPRLPPVLFGCVSTVRAGLAGVVGVYLHTERAGQDGFVVQEGMQFRKGPFGGVPVRTALLLRRLLAMCAFGPLTDMRQVFQANETVRMGVQNVRTHAMIFIQLQPSLSLADGDASSSSVASAFALKSLLEPRVVV